MHVAELLDELGYTDSPRFLNYRQRRLGTVPDYGHIFRLAREKLSLRGVYTLRSDVEAPATPVVYVCQAESEQAADEIHRYVWNQDVVPFLLVHTPHGVKLYSGFRHERSKSGDLLGVLERLTAFNDIAEIADHFSADSIDSGNLWRSRGSQVTPEYRVDWKLLKNLRTLDKALQDDGLPRKTSHALIGKYVYLHYLRDREILSTKKLNKWGVDASAVFGRQATIKGVSSVVDQLNAWLNGSVFPLSFRGADSPRQEHLRYVAGVFEGDEVSGAGERQLSLDFQAYDFSFIPIETLSIVYEQFLHDQSDDKPVTRGREMGAYYTPIPIVNMMLGELEERFPLTKGMRILDPSCGSGAFLVQCFRRLIEKEFPPGSKPRPAELRALLEDHIFGIDVEEDACNVTELSLALTLLDYIDPPDLEDQRHRFKLPALRGKNIFHSNFFSEESQWDEAFTKNRFDWIVGNPPWKKLNPSKLREHERPVWRWINQHKKDRPVGGNQAARAFAWKATDYLSVEGEIALFMPAMTLFEKTATDFRRTFFQNYRVHTVINLSNLAEVLAGRRFRVPAASFFYCNRPQDEKLAYENEFVRTYSPLVANQEPTRPEQAGRRNETWSIVINASEIRDIPYNEITDGSGLPWKLATWGSHLDNRLLKRLSGCFPSLGSLESEELLLVSQGLELRREESPEDVELVDEVLGKKKLDVTALKGLRHIFTFPPESLNLVEEELKYARKGRVKLPLSVCSAPHVIVSAARNFAVYSDEFLVVPPMQIGITSPKSDEQLLKCLSLFLSSEFALYQQFMTSAELGVKRDRATLNALRGIPIPLLDLSKSQVNKWLRLHKELLKTTPERIDKPKRNAAQKSLAENDPKLLPPLLAELNSLVSDALGMTAGERALVEDFVQVRLALNDGKVGDAAVRSPTAKELRKYASCLRQELNDFISGDLPKQHAVGVIYDGLSGMVCVDLTRDFAKAKKLVVSPASASEAKQLAHTRERLRQERAQWVYFDRNLRIYEGSKTYVLKPMQRFHWTVTQAMLDARQILAETLAPSE